MINENYDKNKKRKSLESKTTRKIPWYHRIPHISSAFAFVMVKSRISTAKHLRVY